MYSFRRIQTSDRTLMQVQDAIDSALKPLLLSEIGKGILLPAITVTDVAIAVSHRLQRQPLGWFIVDDTTGAAVYRTAWDTRSITLQAPTGETNTISIWIF